MSKFRGKNITADQKRQIQCLLEAGYEKKIVAKMLEINCSSIYKELQRGLLNGKYNAEYSIGKSLKARKNKGKKPKFVIDKNLANLISDLILREHLSIIQIREKCKKEGIECPSRTALYRSIDDGLIPNVTRKSLRPKTTTMFSNGLIQIPRYIREELKLNDKDEFIIEIHNNQILITKDNTL